MGFAASLATLLVASILTLWAAMSAGRAKTSGLRFGWLAVELVAFLGALGSSAFASIAIASPNQNALGFFVLFILFTGIGFACAGVLIYFEYLRRGHRDRFSA